MQRRNFLKGVGGVAFALPFMESLVDSKAKGAAAEPPPFAIFMRQGNGNVDSKYWPTAEGALTDASMKGTTLEAIAGYKNKLLCVDGVALPYQDGEENQRCGHSYAGAQIMTGAKPNWSASAKNRTTSSGPSIDVEIARYFKGDSLNLIAARFTGHIYAVMSYTGNGQKNPVQPNPYEAYKKLFGMSTNMPGQPQTQGNKELMRSSVNDLIKAQMDQLMKSQKISKSDKARLQAHQETIREIEKNMGQSDLTLATDRIAEIEKTRGWDQNDGKYADVRSIARMQLDIIALAVTTGIVRSACMQYGQGMDETGYGDLGVDNYHNVSHWVGDDYQRHWRVDKVVVDTFKYLLDRLSSYDMGGGKTSLDYGSAIMFNDLRGGLSHSVTRLPFVIAGGMNGKIKQGQYYKAKGEIINNRIWATIAHTMGVKKADGGEYELNADEAKKKGLVKEILT